MVTAGRALRVMDGKSSDPQSRRVLGRPDVLRVDSLGVGGGPFDRLEELQVETIERQRVHLEEFRAGDPSSDPETFRYLKDEAHWHLRDLLEHDRIDLSKLKPEHREKLESQALAIGYEVNSKGQIVVTDKKGMKKALKGESPDVLEAVVIAAWDDAPYDPPPADERMVTNEAIGAPAPAESRDPGVLDEDELPADPMPGERFFDPVDAL